MIDLNKIIDIFVERVNDYLIERQIKAPTLAKELNISYKTLHSWLNKTRVPKIDGIYLIADYLDVSIDYLVGREN